NYIHQYVQLASVKKWLESNALGQTMLNLNTQIMANLPIILFPRPEQTAIADLLSTWDAAIEKKEQLIALKKKIFSGLCNGLMSQITSKYKCRKVKLGEICNLSKGQGLYKEKISENGK